MGQQCWLKIYLSILNVCVCAVFFLYIYIDLNTVTDKMQLKN